MTLSQEASVFLAGALCGGHAVVASFFLRFWMRSRDAFFGFFSAAFWLLAANQAAATFARSSRGEEPVAYLLRLAAFLLVILAVLQKNASGNRAEGRDTSGVKWR